MEVSSFHELHAQEVLAPILPNLINWNDVRMIKLGRRFRLVFEPFDMRLASPLPEKNQFDSDDAIEALLASSKDNTHSAPGNLLHQFVVRQLQNPLVTFLAQ